jgi:UDP-2,4-diacetamido-2,4,6-trideoxy-beta-L-altropyranose hydrolase
MFRADASVTIGAGHVTRCLALADGLSARGFQVGFATMPCSMETVPRLQTCGHDLMILDSSHSLDTNALPSAWANGCDLLVVDDYDLPVEFETACRGWARSIMVIDDAAKRSHDCDILLDPLPAGPDSDDVGRVPAHCETLRGPRFALLRPLFPASRQATLAARSTRQYGSKLFISFGGVDARNLTGRVLERLSARGVTADIDIAIGGASPNVDAARELASGSALSVALHVDSDDVAGLMARADVAIGAAGSMSWERCCMGLPTVAVVVADNQQPIADLLRNSGAAIIASGDDNGIEDVIAAQTETLLGDRAMRSRLSKAAAELCDGLGLERVLDALILRTKKQ